jgi:hypothetical protein
VGKNLSKEQQTFSWWHLLAGRDAERTTLADALGVRDLLEHLWTEQGVRCCGVHREPLVGSLESQVRAAFSDELLALLMLVPAEVNSVDGLTAVAEALQCNYYVSDDVVVPLASVGSELKRADALVLRLGTRGEVLEQLTKGMTPARDRDDFSIAAVSQADRSIGARVPILAPGICRLCETIPDDEVLLWLGDSLTEVLSYSLRELSDRFQSNHQQISSLVHLSKRHSLLDVALSSLIDTFSLRGRERVRCAQAEMVWGDENYTLLAPKPLLHHSATGNDVACLEFEELLNRCRPSTQGVVVGIELGDAVFSSFPSILQRLVENQEWPIIRIAIQPYSRVGDYLGFRRIVAGILSQSESARMQGVSHDQLMKKNSWAKKQYLDLQYGGLSLAEALIRPLTGSSFDAWSDPELSERLEVLSEILTAPHTLRTPLSDLSLREAAALVFFDAVVQAKLGIYICDEVVSEGLLTEGALHSGALCSVLDKFLAMPGSVIFCARHRVSSPLVSAWARLD